MAKKRLETTVVHGGGHYLFQIEPRTSLIRESTFFEMTFVDKERKKEWKTSFGAPQKSIAHADDNYILDNFGYGLTSTEIKILVVLYDLAMKQMYGEAD